jgi:sulfonate transport system ATP-binding protein
VLESSSVPANVAVRVTRASKSFGARRVLDQLSLELVGAEFTALLGRSGSGKTTLLRLLLGLESPDAGRVQVPRQRSVVFQEPRLIPSQRVRDNVLLGLSINTRTRASAERALEEVGLRHLSGAWPETLSGGEAQRVALARALMREPELLLLDEPFGALDALTRLQMHGLLSQLCARHQPAVLLVTHDVDEALALADRVLVLREGAMSLDLILPRHAERQGAALAALRLRLLDELGVH